jgi:hypothetical protein
MGAHGVQLEIANSQTNSYANNFISSPAGPQTPPPCHGVSIWVVGPGRTELRIFQDAGEAVEVASDILSARC